MVLNIHFLQTRPNYIVPKSAPILIENWSVWVNPGQSGIGSNPFEMFFCIEQIIPNYTLQNYSSFSWKVIIKKKLYDVDMSH